MFRMFRFRGRRRQSHSIELADGSKRTFDGRLVTIHDKDKNAEFGFPRNYISTTHYTWWNFIFKNLFQQFRRIANLYFLITAILTTLPFSPYEPYTSIGPLAFVLGVSALREALEDLSRYRQDKATNARTTLVWRESEFVALPWADIVVGDVIKVVADSLVPADLVVLSSSDESCLCYVETANLDGETNLKVKTSVTATQNIPFANLAGELLVENPSNDLYRFKGQFVVKNSTSALIVDNLILRGCVLRNTAYVVGVAVYTGPETRIEMNSAPAPLKRSRVESAMNTEIIRILIIQAVLCILSGVAYGVLRSRDQKSQFFAAPINNAAAQGAEGVLTWILLTAVMLPISLYVTLEIVKVIQGKHIAWDRNMYYEPLDKPCEVRAVGLNEDLGQISHVFADKTGTLTRNEMVFMRASVDGRIYDHINEEGEVLTDLKNDAVKGGEHSDVVNMYLLNLALCHTVIPEKIVDPKTNEVTYHYLSPSPDEEALVSAAATNGYVLTERTQSTISITVPEGRPEFKPKVPLVYTIERVLEFNSDRKRMSIILRAPDQRLLLLTKGADSEIYKRIGEDTQEALKTTTTANLLEFARAGLRTLVLGYRWLDEEVFDRWNVQYEKASISLENRDEMIELANDLIERGLVLVGATAIEDRLQDGVPETLAALRQARIRVWVLTGDKQETAINIGHSSGLLVNGMDILTLNATSQAERDALTLQAGQETEAQRKEREARQAKKHTKDILLRALRHMGVQVVENNGSIDMTDAGASAVRDSKGEGSTPTEPISPKARNELGVALVMDSETLRWALDTTMEPNLCPLLLKASDLCRSVLLCRCSPLQKAQVVYLLKNHPTDGRMPVTLAIGDGANDVGMIKAAHIGVGISGKEGMQAVQNSDYAIAQFAYLRHLLFVHGRWNYRRISLLVVYSFYKNIVLVINQFWFGFLSQFTGQTFYDGLAGNSYNVFFTSGILVTAVLDQDAPRQVLLARPALYQSGIRNEKFSTKLFWTWWLEGLLGSAFVFMIVVGFLGISVTESNGQMQGIDDYGILVYTAAVYVVNFRLALANNHWTWVNWFFFIGSIALWYLFGLLYSSSAGLYFTYSMYWVFYRLFGNVHFYFVAALAAVLCNLPAFCKMALQRLFRPSLKQQLKIAARRGQPLEDPAVQHQAVAAAYGTEEEIQPRHSFRLRKSQKQSSMIFEFGSKESHSKHTGFAMEYTARPKKHSIRAAAVSAVRKVSLMVKQPIAEES